MRMDEVRPRGVPAGEARGVEGGQPDASGEHRPRAPPTGSTPRSPTGPSAATGRRPCRRRPGPGADRPGGTPPRRGAARNRRARARRAGGSAPSAEGQVVGRRQALLLRAVARVGLDVQPEQVPDERGDELVRRHRPEAADRVAAQAEGAGRSQVERRGSRGRADAGSRGSRSAVQPARSWSASQSNTAARSPAADVARPEAGRHGAHARDQLAFGSVVVERRLDLAGQRVVVGGRFVRPLDHRDRARAAERRAGARRPGTAGSSSRRPSQRGGLSPRR